MSPSMTSPPCRHARNPAHVCGEACARSAAEQEALYGRAPASPPASFGRFEELAAARLAGGATPLQRQAQDAAVFELDAAAEPVILTDAQEGWKARELWTPAFLSDAFGGDAVLVADKAPYRASDSGTAQTLREAVAYVQGEDGPLAARERCGARFSVVGWAALQAHPALLPHAQPLHPPRLRGGGGADGTPPQLRAALCSLLAAPPGAGLRLHCAPRGAHAALSLLTGALQLAVYPPADGPALSGGAREACQSGFDPFAGATAYEDWPDARAARARAAVLAPGETLLLPAGWWLAARWLRPGTALRRDWFSAGPHTDAFAASLRAEEAAGVAAAARRVAGVDAPPDAGEEVAAAAEAAGGGGPLERARALRARGNAAFAAGRMREAGELYSAGIDALAPPPSPAEAAVAAEAAAGGAAQSSSPPAADEPLDVAEAAGGSEEAAALLCALLCNRAAVALRRRAFLAALRDTQAVLRAARAHDEVTLKALWRRGKAREGLGDADAAQADFARVLELQPGNAEARETLDAYRSPLHRIVVMSYGDEDTRRRQRGGL